MVLDRHALLLAVVLTSACGRLGFGAVDAAGVDASGVDASGVDDSGVDASSVDASGMDASGVDASGVDASEIDAGRDAGPEPALDCESHGVFVSALEGSDAFGTGMEGAPFATIGEGARLAAASGGVVCVGQGRYPETVVLTEGVSLFGGLECNASSCTFRRDPSAFQSVIAAIEPEGVVVPETVTRATRIDGFTIEGLSGALSSPTIGAAVTVQGGSPIISRNRIIGADVSCTTFCTTAGIVIHGPSADPRGALVVDNRIEAGDSPAGSYGLFLSFTSSPVAEVVGNVVTGGTGRFTRALFAFGSGPGTVVRRNRVTAGPAAGPTGGSSFALSVSGTVLVDGNLVNVDRAAVGSCPSGTTYWCGGIEVQGGSSTITNNIALGMPAPRSTALLISEGEVGFVDSVVNGNTLDGGGDATSILSAAIACRANIATGGSFGRIRNNILLGGSAPARYGTYEDDQTAERTCGPEAFDNNDIFFAPSSSAIDVAHRRWTAAGTAVELLTEADVDAQPWASDNFGADPVLDASWHLGAGSPCIDRGTPLEAPPTDFDGDPRPLGPAVDVGADERR